jgi:hypothetical protein
LELASTQRDSKAAIASTKTRLDELPSGNVILFILALFGTLFLIGLTVHVESSYPDGPRVFTGEYDFVCSGPDGEGPCAEVPVFREDTSNLNYPLWVTLVKGPGYLAIYALVITAMYQASKIWASWKALGGAGLLGRRNHKHRCPHCALEWEDDEPECPGYVRFECPQCWQGRTDSERRRGRERSGGSRYSLSRDNSPTLARDRLWGASKYTWMWIAVGVGLIVLLLVRGIIG